MFRLASQVQIQRGPATYFIPIQACMYCRIARRWRRCGFALLPWGMSSRPGSKAPGPQNSIFKKQFFDQTTNPMVLLYASDEDGSGFDYGMPVNSYGEPLARTEVLGKKNDNKKMSEIRVSLGSQTMADRCGI